MADESQLRILKEGVAPGNNWRKQEIGLTPAKADLTDEEFGALLRETFSGYPGKADLSGAILSGADLSDADLCDADLCDADLRGTNLRGAVLIQADLGEADLRGRGLVQAFFARNVRPIGS